MESEVTAMKLAFEINDKGFTGIDLSNPEKGNPGVGGTQFEFVLLINSLIHLTNHKYDIIVYHYSDNIYHSSVRGYIVGTEEEVLKKAEEEKVDLLIYKTDKDSKWYKYLEKYNIKTLAWAHTYLRYYELKMISKCDKVVRLVCVGKEQYDVYLDDDVITKTEYIYNMVNVSEMGNRDFDYSPQVTYIGSIIREKGFHVLAKAWKEVLKNVPDAQLNVIGSGKLYNRGSVMGKYGIAEEIYENMFMPYLTDNDGNILDSVHFLGVLGAEKQDVIKHTAVGVVNPTAISETFCISAVEFECYGVPVCSCKKNGLLDTVKHNNTGLLSKSFREFRHHIVLLLKNRNLNVKYGENGKKYVKRFSPDIVVRDWVNCIDGIYKNELPKYYKVNGNIWNNGKAIKMLNRVIRINLGIRTWPSVNDFVELGRRFYHTIKKN